MQALEVRPGVAAIVLDGAGRLLLHRRRVGGGWAPPSGAVEPGETVRAALLRELREETALAVEIERLVGVYSEPSHQIVDYPGGRRVHFVTCLFACRVARGELRGSDEGLEWRWAEVDRLPEPLLPYAARWLADALRPGEDVAVR